MPSSARAASPPGADEEHKDSSGRITASAAHRVISDTLIRHAEESCTGEARRYWYRWSILGGAVLLTVVLTQLWSLPNG